MSAAEDAVDDVVFQKKNVGSGVMPLDENAPMSTAVTSCRRGCRGQSGIMAEPVTALLAASGAMTPSMAPLPNCSGCFEVRAGLSEAM